MFKNSKNKIGLCAAFMIPAFSALCQSVPVDTLHVTPQMLESINGTSQLERFDIPYQSVVFVPKGEWITGVSVSYSQQNASDYEFLFLDNIKGETYDFKVSPMVGYAVTNDMVVGGKFAYARSFADLKNAELVVDADPVTSVQDFYSLGHNYYGTAFMRNYFSMGNSRRFGFFSEVQLQLGGGQKKVTSGTGTDLTGSYETNFYINAGVVPGIVIFLNNYSALETTVGILGYNYTHTKAQRNRVYDSERSRSYANFKINLFSVTFGVSFYI